MVRFIQYIAYVIVIFYWCMSLKDKDYKIKRDIRTRVTLKYLMETCETAKILKINKK